MKSLLTALALLALTASSASAHLTDFHFKNILIDPKVAHSPNVTGITLTRVSDPTFHFGADFVPSIPPGHSTTFWGVFETPCEYHVTIHQARGPDIKSETQPKGSQILNVCTHRTIFLHGAGGVGMPNPPIVFAP